MRVLAARFADRRIASAVRDLLHRRMHLAPRDVDIAPLGTAEQRAADDTLLAARCPDHDCAETAALLREAGGVIMVNVDERWTRPRAAAAQTWGSTFNREPAHH
jgi:hypothetical protein